jgi:hypothetical protein
MALKPFLDSGVTFDGDPIHLTGKYLDQARKKLQKITTIASADLIPAPAGKIAV